MFPSSGKIMATPVMLGPLESHRRYYFTLRRKQIQFRKSAFRNIGRWTKYKNMILSNSILSYCILQKMTPTKASHLSKRCYPILEGACVATTPHVPATAVFLLQTVGK
jgi:hypothetical protein